MSESEQHKITTIELIDRPTEVAHALIRKHVKPGDRVVDATVGNGHDTIFLADLVGPSGQVDGFDIQSEAIESTRQKLQSQSFKHIALHQLGHEKMTDLVQAPVQAVMFNLGYLPGGDKQIITRAGTTAAALQWASKLLSPDGIVTIVVYTGHPGGQQEAKAITVFYRSLPVSEFVITVHKPASDKLNAPFLITITRR